MRILAIDDNLDNLIVLKAVVSDHLPGAEVLTASNGPAGLELARDRDPDVILLDIVMPGMDGYAVCRKLKQDGLLQAVPVLFLTALRTDRDSRVRALEAGAEGFLTKPFDEFELIAQIRAMAKIKAAAFRQRTENERLAALVAERTRALEAELEERRQAEALLRITEARLQRAQVIAQVGDWELDLETKTIWASAEAFRIYGLDPTAAGVALASVQGMVVPEDRPRLDAALGTLLAGAGPYDEEFRIARTKDGVLRVVHTMAFLERDSTGTPHRVVGTLQDVTARKQAEEEKAQLEAQLQQALKMESVGRLAGGVAHDFNNMLGVILGHAELAIEGLDPSQPLFDSLQEIQKAAEHSATLTRQLLAFARKQTVVPKVLDLNQVVEGMLKMLRRIIGEDIELSWHPAASLWPLKIDPSQIDQILANLCVNARDAIGGLGRVTIETGNVSLSEADCADQVDLAPGEFCLLTVSDTGCGMDRHTVAHIFEPFFTTKEVGKGTGLGLATVYGIVKQNNGFIDLSSEQGVGTTFRIYLPRHEGCGGSTVAADDGGERLRGQETILVVEDEPALLMMAERMLQNQGYTVLPANMPDEACRLAAERAGEIHLLMTDMVMPGMNGRDLAKRLRALRPRLKCLFMSGYAASSGTLPEGTHFIQKPFSISCLAAKVREALDQR